MGKKEHLGMSVPQNQSGAYVSSILIADHFLPPDDLATDNLLDYEGGPVGLNDPSEGNDYQAWTLRWYSDTGDFVVEAPNTAPTIIHNAPNVTELSLAFDQNGNPFIAYVEDGDAKYWWYDTADDQTKVSNLPANSLTPRCCIDDKRDNRTGTSDIILCYVNGGALKMRWERERYTDEKIVKNPFVHPQTGNPAVLKRIGMNKVNRLQWLCSDPTINEVC